jgi:hypothetical protein
MALLYDPAMTTRFLAVTRRASLLADTDAPPHRRVTSSGYARTSHMTNPIRSKAEEKFAKIRQQDEDAIKERDRAQKELMEKTARLRALRMAKEAADKDAADAAAIEKADKLAAKKAKV